MMGGWEAVLLRAPGGLVGEKGLSASGRTVELTNTLGEREVLTAKEDGLEDGLENGLDDGLEDGLPVEPKNAGLPVELKNAGFPVELTKGGRVVELTKGLEVELTNGLMEVWKLSSTSEGASVVLNSSA